MRHLLILTTLLFFAPAVGCEQPKEVPGPPPTGATGSEDEQPDEAPAPADEPVVDDESAPVAEDIEPSAEADGCPPAREPEGMCAQVISWAKHPETGKCCQYPTPCEAPKDWETFSSQADCTGER